jgi:prevent-host-death family protein
MARQLNSDQRIITATEIRRNFSAIIRRLRKRREHTIIQSSGVPIAVLLPVAEYERLMAYVKRKAAFHDFARNLGREVEQRGISEEELMADLEKTKREVFTEQYGRPA